MKLRKQRCYTSQLHKNHWFFPIRVSSMYEKWSCLILNRHILWYLTQCDVIYSKTTTISIHGGHFNQKKNQWFWTALKCRRLFAKFCAGTKVQTQIFWILAKIGFSARATNSSQALPSLYFPGELKSCGHVTITFIAAVWEITDTDWSSGLWRSSNPPLGIEHCYSLL